MPHTTRRTNGYLVRQRDPFREFDSLVRSAFGAPTLRTVDRTPGFSPAVESHREGDDAVIRFELPGVDVEKDVTVEVKGRVLVVAGERRDERSGSVEGGSFSEFRYGSFRRSFRLAPQVTAEAVTASYDAGVLTVRVAGAFTQAEGHQVAITKGEATETSETSGTSGLDSSVEGEVTESHEG